jgi:4-hydroxy-4-methyl-2-oxoglutarate aldolase
VRRLVDEVVRRERLDQPRHQVRAPVTIGGAEIRPGDLVVLDCDGALALPQERIEDVLPPALERAARERELRKRYAAGELSYDLNGLR